jgi:hypothetical protein
MVFTDAADDPDRHKMNRSGKPCRGRAAPGYRSESKKVRGHRDFHLNLPAGIRLGRKKRENRSLFWTCTRLIKGVKQILWHGQQALACKEKG